MGVRPSRYVVTSDKTFVSPEGTSCRVVYSTVQARVSAIGVHAAEVLERGEVDELQPDELHAMQELGLVVDDTVDELADVVESQRAASRDCRHRVYVLVPTSFCNMGCSYCGQEHTRGVLSADHRRAVLDRITAGIEATGTESVCIRWFGGEPLMGYALMRDLSSDFIRACREAGVGYSAWISTNGALLSPRKLHEMHDHMLITEICITLDGVGATHDVNRPLRSGRSSYDDIVRNVRFLTQNSDAFPNFRVTLRTNVDVRNASEVVRFIDEMARLGFDHPMIKFDLHPVYAWSNDVSQIRLEKRSYAEREAVWLRRMLDHGLDVRLVPRVRKEVLCPAVSRSQEIISSSGRLFSCTEHPLVPLHESRDSLGDLEALPLAHLRPPGAFDGWHDALDQGHVPCSECEFLPTCGGSCPKHWSERDPPCPSYKFNIQERLCLVAERNGMSVVGASAVATGSSD